jgi:hypothetical protein
MSRLHTALRRRNILTALGTALRLAVHATGAAEAILAAVATSIRPDGAAIITGDGPRVLARHGAIAVDGAVDDAPTGRWCIALQSRGRTIA